MRTFMDELIDLAAAKEKYMVQILNKTVEQRLSLSEDEIDTLIEITDQKQILIENYKIIQQQYELCYQNLQKHHNFHVSVDELEKSNEHIQRSLEKINGIEQENEAELKQKMDALKRYVKQINKDKKAYNAYHQTGISVSEFIDQRNC